MADDLAIKVKSVYKDFLLPHEKHKSIKSAFTSLFRQKNKKIEVQHALRNINFNVRKGEFFGIVGRNGSGKSTLLKMLAHIYQPTKGDINVNGTLVPFIELGVGFNAELTGRENVYLNGALLGFSKAQIDRRYQEIVEFAELERFMDQKLKNYSSGMQVRLAFSVAIMANADILLVDEVLAVGDAAFQRKCFDYFHKLKKFKKTVVFVTHDMSAVREYCDRALLIEQSEVVKIGAPDLIAEDYTKLFNEPTKTSATQQQDNQRWGDKRIQFNKVKVGSRLLTNNAQDLTIKLTAKALQNVDDLVFGFAIKNQSGTLVTGTNSQVKRKKLSSVTRGEEFEVIWTCQNIFPDGVFSISVAAHSQDGVTVYDWWNDAVKFEVINAERVPYPMNPPIELNINRS